MPNRFPNFILALVPTELDPTQLNTMIAFATGGLLGDVCMHLIPHSFMGEAVETGLFVDGVAIKHVVVEEKRNIIIGVSLASVRIESDRQYSKNTLCIPFIGSDFRRLFRILLFGQDNASPQRIR